MIARLKGSARHRYRSMFFAVIQRKRVASRNTHSRRRHSYSVVSFPREISINGNVRAFTIQVIKDIHNSILSGKKRIFLDFSKTKKIDASGMIPIYAELFNIKNTFQNIKFFCCKKVSNKIGQVLTQIGIYNMCGQKNFNKKTTLSDVIHWRVCHGVSVICEQIDNIIPDEERVSIPETSDIYGGCIEATKNALRHAYTETRSGIPVAHTKTGWWCFSQVKDQRLEVVVCDLGVSIPKTLPKNFPDIMVKLSHLGCNTDADIIAGALERPRSRSGETYRGNGLPKMVEVASIGGRLTIYSRRGAVWVDGSNIHKKNFKHPLLGTIIAWTLPLGGEV